MSIKTKLKESNRIGKIARRLSISEDKAKKFLDHFGDTLHDYVKKAICCLGLEHIDEQDERKEVAEKILKAIGEVIPAPYSLAWPILKPVVRIIVLEMLEEAAKAGDTYCDGVVCTISPLRITL